MEQKDVYELEAVCLKRVETVIIYRFLLLFAQHPADKRDQAVKSVRHYQVVPVDPDSRESMDDAKSFVGQNVPI